MAEVRSRLAQIVGGDRVVEEPALGESPSLARRLARHFAPAHLVRPRDVGQVQELVLCANETRTPLVPVSSGVPHLRGGSLPGAPGAVWVDLSGMQRILKVDRRNRLALIEPGVTYGQLQSALRKEGLRLNMPLLPRGTKSVMAALLEREPPLSPRYQWNLMEPLRSLEIVWGDGSRFYSGSGTFRGEKDEDWQKGLVPVLGPGPGQADFYKFVSGAQGSMGIVTWASVKCEVHSEVYRLFLVPAGRLEDLLDFTYRLLRFRFGDELFLVSSACLASILAQNAQAIASLKEVLPPWTVVVGIAGGPLLAHERVEAQEADIRDIARQFGLSLLPAVPGWGGEELLALLQGPSAEPYWRLRARGGSHELFFLATLDRAPAFVATVEATAAEQGYPAQDIGVYLQPVHQGVGCHCEFILPFDPGSLAEVRTTEALFREASRRLLDQKAYFSRPYGIWAEMVYGADPTTAAVTQSLKQVFDPHGVMNPGKLCF